MIQDFIDLFSFILPSCLHMSNHKLWFILIKFSHLIHKIPIKFIWLICLLRYCKLCPIQYNPLFKAENVIIVWPGCLKDFSKKWGRLTEVNWEHSLCSWYYTWVLKCYLNPEKQFGNYFLQLHPFKLHLLFLYVCDACIV